MNGHEHSELSRRDFLTYGAAGVAAALTTGTLSADETGGGGGGGAAMGDGVEETTILELQQSMASGERTARSLTEEYLARIDMIDRAGPALNSVLALNPDALDIASALDRERHERGPRGALHGRHARAVGDRGVAVAGSYGGRGRHPDDDDVVAVA